MFCIYVSVSFSVFENYFSFFLEFSLLYSLILSPTFSILSVSRGSLFPKMFVCFASEFVFLCLYLIYLSVFPWSSHFHLLCCYHQRFLSCLFWEVLYSPKRLSVLNQNLCFFVCIWNFFPFFFKFSPSSYLVLSLTFLKCFSIFFWELSTSSFLLSVLLTFLTITTFGVWSSLILSLFSLPLHSRNVKPRLEGCEGYSGSLNNLLIFFDRFKLIIKEEVGK